MISTVLRRFPFPQLHDRLLLGGTVGLVAAAVGYVIHFGTNCPVGDEWHLLKETLDRGFSWEWVIAHHNEHRFVAAKAVWYAALSLTGFDFRAGMFVSLGLLVASVGLVLAAVRRRGGRWTVADLFVPVLLLHWGHWFTWLMGYQVAFSLVAFSAAGFAWAVTHESEKQAAWRATPFLGLLALCGGYGVGWCGPMILWVAFVAWRQRSVGLTLVPVAVAAYLAFVVQTTPPPQAVRAKPNAVEFLESCGMYLGTGFGPAAFDDWGGPRVAATLLGVGLVGAAVGVAGRTVFADPRERVRAAGLLAALLGHVAVTLSVAYYRGTAQGNRFVTPSAAGLVLAGLTLRLYGPARRGWLAAAVVVFVFVSNVTAACRKGLVLYRNQETFLADLDRGTPALFLAGQYGGQWLIQDPLGQNIAAFRDAKVGVFRRLPADPPFVSMPVDEIVGPCDRSAFEPGGPPKPAVAIAAATGPVFGLRVRFEQTGTEAFQEVALVWTDDGRDHRAATYPTITIGNQSVIAFATTTRPTNVRLEAATTTRIGLKVRSIEWLGRP